MRSHFNSMISNDSIIIASTDQVSCDLAGETAILNLKNQTYYGLNVVGTYIWELLKTPQTVEDLRDAVVKRYNVSLEQSEADLLVLLADMAKEKLITVQNATTQNLPSLA